MKEARAYLRRNRDVVSIVTKKIKKEMRVNTELMANRIKDLNKEKFMDALEDAVKEMTDTFLAWKLPADFNPDGGVSFSKPKDEISWPVGTNLLTATQAKLMFAECLPEIFIAALKAAVAAKILNRYYSDYSIKVFRSNDEWGKAIRNKAFLESEFAALYEKREEKSCPSQR